jgi:hypothetical protein
MISSISEMYWTAVTCYLWMLDSCCIACRLCLSCKITNMLWTLAILCNVCASTSLCIPKLIAVFVRVDTMILQPNALVLAWARLATIRNFRSSSECRSNPEPQCWNRFHHRKPWTMEIGPVLPSTPPKIKQIFGSN